MKKKLLFIIPIAAVAGLVLLSTTKEKYEKYHVDGMNIVNHNLTVLPAKTGAPGENNCTQCHSTSSVMAADGSNGATTTLTSYQIGQTYTFAMGSLVNTNNGFQMTILDNNDNKAGDFVAGAANTTIQSSGGREYINHSTKTQAWSFDWTAPSTDVGSLTAYYSMNATDNSGGTTGDQVYVGTISITSDITNGLTNHQIQDQKVNMYFDEQTSELNVKYKLNKKSLISVQVVDLSGKVIETAELGSKSFGPHSEKIQLENINAEGIYIVSLFIDNGIYTRKVYLK